MSTYDEIEKRIRRHLASKGETQERDIALAWSGYAAALLEWGLITPSEYDRLFQTLPETSSDTIREIFTGVP